MSDLPDWVRFFVVPILIGVISALVGAAITYLQDKARRERENLQRQLDAAIEICRKIIQAMDTIHARMKYDAWHVVWRKARPSATESEELKQSDQDKWKAYNDMLTEWRANLIAYETELKGSFSSDGPEAALFEEISQTFEAGATMLWTTYYAAARGETFTEEDQEKSREMYFGTATKQEANIIKLSNIMINCVKYQNVGNLREAQSTRKHGNDKKGGGAIRRRRKGPTSDIDTPDSQLYGV